MSKTERLCRLLAERSVRMGNFTLASGKSSSVYIDARLTTMSPEGMLLIGEAGLEQIESSGWQPDAIGGLTLGADPVAYAVSHTSASRSRPLRAFTVRKQPKTHGTGQLIEGPFKPGDRVVIAEDVITSGNSALQAIDAVTSAGGKVTGVLAVVDRQEGGRETIEARGYAVLSLATMTEIIPFFVLHDSDAG